MTPTYFQSKKNNSKSLRDISCTFTMFRDILGRYPTGYRGGTHDSNGRRTFNRRGGGSLTENAPGLCQETLARWKDCRGESDWTRRALARQTVHDRETDREATRDQLNSRKLNYFAFSATTQRTAIAWNPLTERCRRSLLHVHYSLARARTQQVAHSATNRTGIMGYEVAVREDYYL